MEVGGARLQINLMGPHILHDDLAQFGERVCLGKAAEEALLCVDVVQLGLFGEVVGDGKQKVTPGNSVGGLLQKISVLLVYIFIGRVGFR
jgi:hypothetical protein